MSFEPMYTISNLHLWMNNTPDDIRYPIWYELERAYEEIKTLEIGLDATITYMKNENIKLQSEIKRLSGFTVTLNEGEYNIEQLQMIKINQLQAEIERLNKSQFTAFDHKVNMLHTQNKIMRESLTDLVKEVSEAEHWLRHTDAYERARKAIADCEAKE